jgi:hypothetical protein
MAIVANANDYAGAGGKTPSDKIVEASIGGIAATAAVSNSAATSAQSQLNAGASIPSIEAYIASLTDNGINADAGNYMNNRTPDRAAASDVAKTRTPRVSGVYRANIPQTKITEIKKNNTSSSLFLLSDMMKDGKMPYMQIAFSKYERPNPFAPAKLNPEQTIYMPLPQELLDPTQIEWSLTTLNTVGNLANLPGATNAADAATATAAAAGMSLLEPGIKAMASTTERLSKVGGSTLGQITSSAVSGASQNIVTLIEQSLGAVPNPNPSYAFRGPSLRTYSFSWIIHPRNETESQNMMNIINALKKHALPGTKIGTNTALLDYPSMCQVNLKPWDNGSGPYQWGENTFIKYKKSVITGISANFAPNGVPAFFRGSRKAPVFAALTISFAEIEFFTDLDYGAEGGSTVTDFIGDAIGRAANTYSSFVGTIGDAAGQIIAGSAGLITDPPAEDPPAEPPA